MARLAEGEVDLLGELYLRHGAAVRRRLTCYVPDISMDEVEDLCQEVFLLAYKAAPRYVECGQLAAWLCAIAAKKAHGYRRRRWIRKRILGQFANEQKLFTSENANSPDSSLVVKQQYVRALLSLPSRHRDILMLYAAKGMDAEEIAETLGIRVGAVWTRLHRARTAMQKAMEGGRAPRKLGEER